MSLLPTYAGDPLGLGGDANQSLIPHRRTRRLGRILAFCGHGIDDVINDPVARRRVRYYYKLDRQITRHGEVRELERQWNPLGRSA